MNKYSFRQMIGNSNTLSLMERMLSNGTFSKFTIFEGTLGTGKSTASRIAAMRLTCEHPIDGQPCCTCQTCKNNMRAFETSGESLCVKEAHVLKDLNGAQTAFLEEIDRMPPNTYVIMCTTRAYDVIDELASRALVFPFRRLSEAESLRLIKREADGQLDPGVIKLVAKSSKGIPRKIINSIDFIKNNEVSEEEYREFINEVSESSISLLLYSMTTSSMSAFVDACEGIMNKRMPATVYDALKDFLLQALFSFEGATSNLSKDTLMSLQDTCNAKQIDKSLQLLGKYSNRLSESDLMFMLYQMRLIMQQRTVSDVYRDAPKVAAISKAHAKEEQYNEQKQTGSVLTRLSVHSIDSFN